MKILVSRKIWLISIAGALAAHLVLYGLLGMSWGEVRDAVTGGEAKPVAAGGNPGEGETSPTIDTTRLARQIDAGMEQLIAVPVAKNLEELRKSAAWLERNSSEKAVTEISAVVRKATGAPERAYAPADPPPPGEFDMKSMLPYASKQVTGADGVVRKEETWVDKDGRALRQTFRKGVGKSGETVMYHGVYMPSGELFEAETEVDSSLSVLDTVAESPLLQRLYREALLPALEARRKDWSAPKASNTPSGD